MPYECFDVDISDAVAHLRLSRPDELNTMTAAFWRELPEIVTRISDDASARVVVVSSTGRHFSAGMDLSVFAGDHLQAGADPAGGTRGCGPTPRSCSGPSRRSSGPGCRSSRPCRAA